MSSGPVLQRLSFGNLPFFGRITHVKRSWGRAYQQSSKGTSWRSSSMQYGNGGTTTMVSCTQRCSRLVYTTIYSNGIYQYKPGITWYIPVYTMYTLVYTSIYHNEYGICRYEVQRTEFTNLWIEGLKALLGHIKGITSCTHSAPEKI